MKMTLLEMTQACLRSISGEEITAITDTAESLAVSDIVKEVYFSLISQQNFPELYTLFELTASADDTKPTLMTLPSTIVGLEWVKYNKRLVTDTNDMFQDVHYLPLWDFKRLNHGINTTESEIGQFTVSTVPTSTIDFFYRKDRAPTYYTTYDDNTIIFDSWDRFVDGLGAVGTKTLQKAKTECWGLKEETWSATGSFTPLLDAQQFTILLKDAKAMTWMELRQTQNVNAEKESRRSRIRAEVKKNRVNYDRKLSYYTDYPNYGRR